MIRAVVVALLLAACGKPSATTPSDDAVAAAAVERKAVADTDGARRDATAPAEPNTRVPG